MGTSLMVVLIGIVIWVDVAWFLAKKKRIESQATRTWGPAMRTLGSLESPPEETFIGEYADLTAPTGDPRRGAQLDLFDWGVRLRRLDSPQGQVWEVQYAELINAHPIRSLFMPVKGVLLHPAPGIARPMIFWTGRDADVISRLERRGVRVEQAGLTFEWLPRPRIRMRRLTQEDNWLSDLQAALGPDSPSG